MRGQREKRETVEDVTHEGEEMKTIRGEDTDLIHDFGTDSIGQVHLYTTISQTSGLITQKSDLVEVLTQKPPIPPFLF